jgi:hypothetical protein
MMLHAPYAPSTTSAAGHGTEADGQRGPRAQTLAELHALLRGRWSVPRSEDTLIR